LRLAASSNQQPLFKATLSAPNRFDWPIPTRKKAGTHPPDQPTYSVWATPWNAKKMKKTDEATNPSKSLSPFDIDGLELSKDAKERHHYSELTSGEKVAAQIKWMEAFWAFNEGEPKYLAALFRSDVPIPPDFYEPLARLIESSPPKLRGRGRAQLDLLQRQHVWSELEKISDMRKAITRTPGALEITAQMNNMEPAEVLAFCKQARSQKITELANQFGVSTTTIEKVFKEYPKRMGNLR
jgi:hypothetical protein